jgi:cytosine/adenosine deaminase-related metal-dependent hydrolase
MVARWCCPGEMRFERVTSGSRATPDSSIEDRRMSLLIKGPLALVDPRTKPEQADIIVEGDRIAAIGPGVQAPPGTKVIDARDHLAMPGLVNAHTHAHHTLPRSVADGLPLEMWVPYMSAWGPSRTPRELYVGAAIGAIEMAKTGITCACDMASVLPWPTGEHVDAIAQAYVDVGLRASLACSVSELSILDSLAGLRDLLPPEIRGELEGQPAYPTQEVLAVIREASRRWDGAVEGRIRFGVAPNNLIRCSDAFMEACAELAAERRLTVQTHLEETKASAYTARQLYGKSATSKLHDVGLLGPRTLLAHCVWVDDEDIDLIASTGSSVVHNPAANLKLGSGIAPVVQMRERGCNVALGTDGGGSSDNLNLFGQMKEAAMLVRVADPNYERWLGAGDVVEMATANGARAAGFGDEVGRLEVGKKADLVLLDLRSSYFRPRNDVVTQLVFSEVGSSVTTVIVDGKVIVDAGAMTTVDEAALAAEAEEIARRVASGLDQRYKHVQRLEGYVRQALFDADRAAWPVNRFATEAYRELPSA